MGRTCGSCHALARAGTKGTQGPSLDAAFASRASDGMDRRRPSGRRQRQIAHPRREQHHAANLVTGDDARDVAAYVAASPASRARTRASWRRPACRRRGKPAVAKAGMLQIAADPTGALAFASTKATAAPVVEFVMENASPVEHNIALEGTVDRGPGRGQGGKSKFSVDLKAGKYVYLCTVPGHAGAA